LVSQRQKEPVIAAVRLKLTSIPSVEVKNQKSVAKGQHNRMRRRRANLASFTHRGSEAFEADLVQRSPSGASVKDVGPSSPNSSDKSNIIVPVAKLR
jgi:hypothetical protein